jgi:hypothetical protein
MGRKDLGVVVAHIEYYGRWHARVPTFSLSRRGTGPYCPLARASSSARI